MRPAISYGRPRSRAYLHRVLVMVLFLGALIPIHPAFADEIAAYSTTPAPNAMSPGLNLDSKDPPSLPKRPLVRRWWFWTAIGAATATAIVLVAVSRNGSTPPASLLGNQEFQP